MITIYVELSANSVAWKYLYTQSSLGVLSSLSSFHSLMPMLERAGPIQATRPSLDPRDRTSPVS
jgi:hypothetical protein